MPPRRSRLRVRDLVDADDLALDPVWVEAFDLDTAGAPDEAPAAPATAALDGDVIELRLNGGNASEIFEALYEVTLPEEQILGYAMALEVQAVTGIQGGQPTASAGAYLAGLTGMMLLSGDAGDEWHEISDQVTTLDDRTDWHKVSLVVSGSEARVSVDDVVTSRLGVIDSVAQWWSSRSGDEFVTQLGIRFGGMDANVRNVRLAWLIGGERIDPPDGF